MKGADDIKPTVDDFVEKDLSLAEAITQRGMQLY